MTAPETPDTGGTVGRVEAPLTGDVAGAMDADTLETLDTEEILAVCPKTVEAVDPGEAGFPELPGVPGVPGVPVVPGVPAEPETDEETDPLTRGKEIYCQHAGMSNCYQYQLFAVVKSKTKLFLSNCA